MGLARLHLKLTYELGPPANLRASTSKQQWWVHSRPWATPGLEPQKEEAYSLLGAGARQSGYTLCSQTPTASFFKKS